MFEERFKLLREKMGFSQKDIAKFLDISETAVGKYEHGKGLPTVENLKKLRKLFNVPLDYLLALDIEDANEIITNYDKNLICEKIKDQRQIRNLTQKEFAFMTDLTIEEVKNIEKGVPPSIDKVIKLCSLLDLTLNELLGEVSQNLINSEQKELVKFALDIDNKEYIKLAKTIKDQGLSPSEVVIGKKI